jgi:hypothetical protein
MNDTSIYYLERRADQRLAERISAEEFKPAHVIGTRALSHHGAIVHLAIRALRVVEIFALPGAAALEWYRAQEAKPDGVRW